MSQTDRLIALLKAGHSITQREAMRLGLGTRLAARIHEARRRGLDIISEWETDGHARWPRYSMGPSLFAQPAPTPTRETFVCVECGETFEETEAAEDCFPGILCDTCAFWRDLERVQAR